MLGYMAVAKTVPQSTLTSSMGDQQSDLFSDPTVFLNANTATEMSWCSFQHNG